VHRSFRSTSCFLIVLLAFASDGVLTPDNSVRAQGATAIPRTADGKPDFSGIWQAMTTASWDIQDHAAQKGVPGGPGIVVGNEIPYQPAALAKKKENYEKRATLDPEAKCYLAGIPRMMYMPFPFQIIQTPRELTMLFEYVHAVRYIFMNGEPHPRGPIEWWQGDARGRWEGDTLVVDLVHFNDQTWFDRAGNFHSEALHLVERYTMISPDHIQYDVTVEDSKVFTRPWNMSLVLYRNKQKNAQLFDYECYAFDLEKYYPYPEMRTPQ
jgi:hypothetical protein